MSPRNLRIIIAVLLFVHAIGHIQGVIASLGILNSNNWNARSWLFDGLIGPEASRGLVMLLMAVCALGFLAAAFAFLNIGLPHSAWRAMAIIFAVPSLLGVICWWNIFAQAFNKVGALGVNAWILIGLLVLKWPSEQQIGF